MIGTIPIAGDNFSANIVYVVLPSDIDRTKYIALCNRTYTVSCRGEDGAFYNRIPISKQLLNELQFPESITELGTRLLCINEPLRNQLIAVAVLSSNTEIGDLQEGEFRLSKSDRETKTTVQISGSAKQKHISLIINTEEEKGGNMTIQVVNKSKTANLNIQVHGKMSLEAVGSIDLVASENINLLTKSTEDDKVQSSIKQTPKQQQFDSTKQVFGNGEEKVLLGEATLRELRKDSQLLKALLSIINGATIPEPGNGSPSALQIALKAALQTQQSSNYTEDVFSKKIFIE